MTAALYKRALLPFDGALGLCPIRPTLHCIRCTLSRSRVWNVSDSQMPAYALLLLWLNPCDVHSDELSFDSAHIIRSRTSLLNNVFQGLQLVSKLLIRTNGARPNIPADSRFLHCRIPSLVPIFPCYDMPHSNSNVYFMGNNHKCVLFQDANPLPKTMSLLPW